MLYGVDVHAGYQAGLNFTTLKNQGYTFCTVKLTEGTGFTQSGAKDFVAKSKAAGLITGVYHWLDSSGPGETQARYFYKAACAVNGGTVEGLLIQLDVEDDAYGPHMRAFAAEWNKLSGNHPFIIYSGGWWWPKTGGFNGSTLTPYLWHSHYLTADTDSIPDNPATYVGRIPTDWWTPGYGGWKSATFLQFTSKGDAGGLANKVDLNATKLTVAQLKALCFKPADPTPTPTPPPPAPTPGVTPVSYNEVMRTDAVPNSYGDKATNPTITMETAIRNISADTDQANNAAQATLAQSRGNGGQLSNANDKLDALAVAVGLLATELAVVKAKAAASHAILVNSGGNPETAAILAGVDARITALLTKMAVAAEAGAAIYKTTA